MEFIVIRNAHKNDWVLCRTSDPNDLNAAVWKPKFTNPDRQIRGSWQQAKVLAKVFGGQVSA